MTTPNPVTPPPAASPESANLVIPPSAVPQQLSDLKITPPGWDWRVNQRGLVQRILQADTPIVMLEAECGTGKSIIGVGAAAAMTKYAPGTRSLVLIQTIQLQEQYLRDFPHMQLMKGRRHSICNLTNQSAEFAPCRIGKKCAMKGTWERGYPLSTPTCNYFKAKADAVLAPITVQNYAYWLREARGAASSFGKNYDLIICDEGHELDQILMAAGTLEFSMEEFRALDLPRPTNRMSQIGSSIPEFRAWLTRVYEVLSPLYHATKEIDLNAAERLDTAIHIPDLTVADLDDEPGLLDAPDATDEAPSQLDAETNEIKRIAMIRENWAKIEEALSLSARELNDWVVDHDERNTYFKPIYGKYGFKALRAAGRKIVIMSAFLGPELLRRTLDIDPADLTVITAPPAFNRSDSPILYCPTFKLSYRTTDKQWKYVTRIIDSFSTMYNAKGLVHVPSVKLRDTILDHSQQKTLYIAYDGEGSKFARYPKKDAAIAAFIKRPNRAILIGQSISTGLDIPYVPKWQVITKLWFAPTEDPAIKKRMEVDKNFYTYHSICQIVQAAGRIKRAPDDSGPTIILDGQFQWFYAANSKFFPKWFNQAMVYDGWAQVPGLAARRKEIAASCGLVLV